MEETKHIYTLELTERQAKLLSCACDQFPRLIQGQDGAYQDLFEQAWEKRCKEATGDSMHKAWDCGWYNMRHEAEKIANEIKKKFWGLDKCALNGIRYDDAADILWDIHRVLRHQFYKDRGDTSLATVDSENPTSSVGSEPLAIVRQVSIPTKELKADIARLYTEIDNCISDLVVARGKRDDKGLSDAHWTMETLIVQAQQELKAIYDYFD